MKKTTLCISALFATTLICPAQESDKQYKPDSNDVGFSFHLEGLVNNIALNAFKDFSGKDMLVLHKYVREDISLRFGFGLTTTREKRSTVDSVFTTGSSQVQWDSTYSKNDFFFSPGVEKHLGHSARLDPYVGAEITLGLLGKSNMKSRKVTTDTVGVATLEITGNQDGGFYIGLGVITGFDYFFTPKLCIGAEYKFGFASSTDGGEWSTVTIDTPASGTGTTKREVGSDITTTSGLSVEATGGITLSYYFSRGHKKHRRKSNPEKTE